MERIKKGILYTLSVFLISISMLYLLTSISFYSNSLKTTAASISSIEKLGAYSDSINYQIKSILESEAVNITIMENENNAEIHFYEKIPMRGGYSSFLTSFRDFAEANLLFDVTINTTEAKRPILYISPCNITVDHSAGKTCFTPFNDSENLIGYTLLIRINESIPKLNWTALEELESTDEDAIYFHVGLQGRNGAVSTTKYLDKKNYSELKMTDSENESIFVFQIDFPGGLIVNHNTEADMEAILEINESTGNLNVELGKNILYVASKDGKTKKTSKVIFEYEN